MSETATTFDVVVIGAGPVGEVAAGRCADGGLSVAIVESELVGGECSYWACIPSKTLIRPGDVIAAARRAPGAAEALSAPLDVAAALAWRDDMTSNWDDTGALSWLDEKHLTLFRGAGRLTGPRTVDVVSEGTSKEQSLHARRAVILATGSAAVVPDIAGLADVDPWDNRGATAAASIPRRLLTIGGGPVGAELTQAFRRLGAEEVTLLEGGERLLAREEPFAGEEVAEAMRAEGITVVTGVGARHFARTAEGITATLDDGREFTCDQVLVAVGRRPRTEGIGLETAGLEPGRPVRVDDQLRAIGVPDGWLYAVGDCNGLTLLTHMGKYQARLCADVILGRDGIADLADHRIVTRVTFTDPQVAAVGLTEAEARHAGIDVKVISTPTGGVAGSSVQGRGITGTSQLVVDRAREVVVGATFTGPDVQELLHSASVAVAGEVPLARLWHAVPAFPTVSEVWLNLLEAYGL